VRLAALKRGLAQVSLHLRSMQKTFDAVYENGLLRPLEPLALAERQHVSLTIDETAITTEDDDLLDQELLANLNDENYLRSA
jgi:predicted DNA-binding antitoxin AbrB/MazE fold protein